MERREVERDRGGLEGVMEAGVEGWRDRGKERRKEGEERRECSWNCKGGKSIH